mmetsp:Transcript_20646/g.48796  ORF Transcript_20646/g.48796 Transcript_20646/m.48796 type:complete len:176 (-) Transcript_20646:240-767(-)
MIFAIGNIIFNRALCYAKKTNNIRMFQGREQASFDDEICRASGEFLPVCRHTPPEIFHHNTSMSLSAAIRVVANVLVAASSRVFAGMKRWGISKQPSLMYLREPPTSKCSPNEHINRRKFGGFDGRVSFVAYANDSLPNDLRVMGHLLQHSSSRPPGVRGVIWANAAIGLAGPVF